VERASREDVVGRRLVVANVGLECALAATIESAAAEPSSVGGDVGRPIAP
jgi:hypothetical protein